MSIFIEDIRAIASNSDYMTKEEQALGYFIKKKLKKLTT